MAKGVIDINIGVISEPHLGRKQFRKTEDGINIIEKEGYNQWFKSIDNIIDKNPDILFISGDLFDTPNPSSIAISNAIKGFSKLKDTDIAVMTIGGNHEFDNRNYIKDSHPFNILETIFPEYDFVTKDWLIRSFNGYNIVMLPHQPVELKEDMSISDKGTKNMYADIVSSLSKNDNYNILVTHGLIESWAKGYINNNQLNDSMKISNMIVNDEFANNFNTVIIGHNHQHFVEKVDKTKLRISPGSILDERNEKDYGPMQFNTENSKIEYMGLKNINTYKLHANSVSELLKIFREVEQDQIYNINFNGKWNDIPTEDYKEALRKALYLNITNSKTTNPNDKPKKIKGFWDWISSYDFELKKEFESIILDSKKEV